MYECLIKITPKGISPIQAEEIRSFSFETVKQNKKDLLSEAYRHSSIDSYALRNHYDIFDVQISFSNPPWDDRQDLIGELLSYENAVDYRIIENNIYIDIEDPNCNRYIRTIKNYYAGLKPKRVHNDSFVRITYKPILKD